MKECRRLGELLNHALTGEDTEQLEMQWKYVALEFNRRGCPPDDTPEIITLKEELERAGVLKVYNNFGGDNGG